MCLGHCTGLVMTPVLFEMRSGTIYQADFSLLVLHPDLFRDVLWPF